MGIAIYGYGAHVNQESLLLWHGAPYLSPASPEAPFSVRTRAVLPKIAKLQATVNTAVERTIPSEFNKRPAWKHLRIPVYRR